MKPRFTSITTRLSAYFLLLSVITVSIASYLSFALAQRALEDSMEDRLQATLNLKVAELNQWVRDKQSELLLISSLEEVKSSGLRLLQQDGAAETTGSSYRSLSDMFRSVRTYNPDFSEVLLLSRYGGKVIVSSNKLNEGDYRINNSYFKQGLLGNHIQNIYLNPVSLEPTITLTAPFLDRDGVVKGVLAAHLSLDRMDNIILSRAGLGRTGQTFLVDSTNSFISARRFGSDEFRRGAHSEGIEQALGGQSGYGLYVNHYGRKVVGAFRWIPDRNMAILAEIEQSEAFKPARLLGQRILLAGLLLSLILSLAIQAIARRITEPIKAVRDTAILISEGEQGLQAPIVRDDEVGDLAMAFNNMVNELTHLYLTLEESEEKYRLLADNATDVIWTMNPEMKLTYVSPSVFHFRGYTAEEAVGQRLDEILTSASFEQVEQLYKLAMKQITEDPRKALELKPLELEYFHRDGHRVWGELNMSIIRDRDGKPMAVLGSTRDITSRVEVQQALVESEERLRTIFATIPDAVIITSLDDGTIVDANRAFSDLTGYEPEDFFGMPVANLYHDPSLREEFIKELIENGVLNNYENVYKLKDGSLKTGLSASRVIELGGKKRILSIIKDITDLKDAQQSLKESEERFRQISEAAFEGIAFSERGRIIDANEQLAQILGYSAQEVVGLEVSKFIAPEFKEDVMEKTASRFEGSGELKAIKADGSIIDVEARSRMLKVGDREMRVTAIMDITDRIRADEQAKELQMKLIQTDKMASLGLMVSGLAHDINNPNNTIMFNLKRVEKTWSDARPILDAHFEQHGDFNLGGVPYSELKLVLPRLLEGSMQSSDAIQGIIKNLKDFVRQTGSVMNLEVDLNQALERALALMEAQVRKGMGSLDIELESSLPPFAGNPQKVVQVALNLISNALESLTDEGQKVRISTSVDKKSRVVLLTIADEGRGMEPDVLKNAAEAFFSTKIDEGGTGLGLTITNTLVNEHGGTMDIQSKPAQGTTVTVAFPTVRN
jgi:PAS domain S-box-containing protein